MFSSARKRKKWEQFQARKAATTFGTPAPADRDERTERERRLLDRYLAERERERD
jgi:hypothetical protein